MPRTPKIPGERRPGLYGRIDAALKRHIPWLWFRLKVIFAVAAALAVLVFLVSVGLDVWGSLELRSARSEAAAKGVKLSRPAAPSVSEEKNAANYYEAAFSLLRAEGAAPSRQAVPLVSGMVYARRRDLTDDQWRVAQDLRGINESPVFPMPDYVLADTKAYVNERAVIIDLLRRGYNLPEVKYHETYIDPAAFSSWSWEEWYRNKAGAASRLMALAAWVEAEEGRGSDAAATVRQNLAMAMSFRNEPRMIPALVGMACTSITVSGLTRVASRAKLSNADLEALQKDFEKYAAELSLRPASEGELALVCGRYQALLTGRITLRELFGQTDDHWSRALDEGLLTRMLVWMWDADAFRQDIRDIRWHMPVWLMRGVVKADEAAVIRYSIRFLGHADKPTAAFFRSGDPAMAKALEGFHPVAEGTLPGAERALLQCELTRAKLKATAAGIAALRYRNDKGRWPETLEALAPKYLDKVPIDPLSGGSLMYKVLDDGIVIYSVGENGVDDGGQGYISGTGARTDADDVGFCVRKPSP